MLLIGRALAGRLMGARHVAASSTAWLELDMARLHRRRLSVAPSWHGRRSFSLWSAAFSASSKPPPPTADKDNEGRFDREKVHEVSLTHYRRGQELLSNEKDFAAALAHFIAAIRAQPGWTEPLFAAGVCCQNLGRVDDALAYYRETTRQMRKQHDGQRHHTTAECAIAECLAELGHIEDAIKQYSRVIKIDPSYAPAYGGRADCWLVWGQQAASRQRAAAEQAERDYRRVLDIEPSNVHAYQGLANMFVSLERVDKAVEAYEGTLKVDPNNVASIAGLALLRQEQGQLDASLQLITSAIDAHHEQAGTVAKDSALARQRSGLYCQRAALNVAMQRWSHALDDADVAVQLIDQHFALAQIVRGQSAHQLQRFDVAAQAFTAVVDELPNSSASGFDGSLPLSNSQIAEVLLMRGQSFFGVTFPDYVRKANDDNDNDNDDSDEAAAGTDIAVDEVQNPLVPSDFENVVRDNYNLLRSYVKKTKQPEGFIAKQVDSIIQDCSRCLQVLDSETMQEDVYDLLLSLQEALEDELARLDSK